MLSAEAAAARVPRAGAPGAAAALRGAVAAAAHSRVQALLAPATPPDAIEQLTNLMGAEE